jgi:hypothetical protein
MNMSFGNGLARLAARTWSVLKPTEDRLFSRGEQLDAPRHCSRLRRNQCCGVGQAGVPVLWRGGGSTVVASLLAAMTPEERAQVEEEKATPEPPETETEKKCVTKEDLNSGWESRRTSRCCSENAPMPRPGSQVTNHEAVDKNAGTRRVSCV